MGNKNAKRWNDIDSNLSRSDAIRDHSLSDSDANRERPNTAATNQHLVRQIDAHESSQEMVEGIERACRYTWETSASSILWEDSQETNRERIPDMETLRRGQGYLHHVEWNNGSKDAWDTEPGW